MKLTKSRNGDKYVLTFEIEPHEAQSGGLNWQSKKLIDFVDALVAMTKPKNSNPFKNIFGGGQGGGKTGFNTNDPFEALRRGKGFSQKFDPNFGSFSQEELNEYLRREQARQQASGWAGSTGTQPGFKPAANWTKVLELPETATKDQIKARYRELAKKHHPDRGGNAATFAKITEAYDQAMAVKS